MSSEALALGAILVSRGVLRHPGRGKGRLSVFSPQTAFFYTDQRLQQARSRASQRSGYVVWAYLSPVTSEKKDGNGFTVWSPRENKGPELKGDKRILMP